jgi:phospholipase C
VSPYAPSGVVNHETFDSTSILRFIEDNWQLRSLARRDAEAHSIASAFAFGRAPRAARLGAGTNRVSNVAPERTAVYLSYGAGGVAAATAIAAGSIVRRRRTGGAEEAIR